MGSEVKKKNVKESNIRSKGANSALWILSVLLILVSAFFNSLSKESLLSNFGFDINDAVKILIVIVLIVVAIVLLAFTNQGQKSLAFLKGSKVELKKISWPTRSETMQTTFIIVGVTVVVSLILWAMDSLIVTVIKYLTSLRF